MATYIRKFLLIAATIFVLSYSASTQALQKFRVAVMYSDPRALDVKCAIDAAIPQLLKANPDIEITTIPYGDDPAALGDISTKIAAQNYDAIIGPMLSHEVQMVGPAFAAKQIPLFLPIASNPELTRKFPNAIRMISNSDHYAQLAAANALRSQQTKSILILTNDSYPYSRDYSQEFQKQLRLRGFSGILRQYKFLLNQADFSAITKIVAQDHIDFIYAPIYSEDIASIYLTLSDAKVKTRLFTHAGMFDAKSTILAHFNPNISVQFNGIWDQRTHGNHSLPFLKSLAKSCDLSQLKPWTMAAWDAVSLSIATHKKSPNLRGLDFVNAVHKMSFVGILGDWNLDEHNDPIRSLPVYSLSRRGMKLDTIIPATETNSAEESD